MVTRPIGRAASPVRPGLFIREYLLRAGEDHPSEIHRSLKDIVRGINQTRRRCDRIKAPTFASFYRYLKHLQYFGLVELSGREEPVELVAAALLYIANGQTRPAVLRYYRLTDKGRAEPAHEAFSNPIGVWLRQGYR